ncbi:MAG: hypothetical protein ACOYJD_02755 [Christensenellales bacterium]|jgi:hypothetical protein
MAKVFVGMHAVFSPEGSISPRKMIWPDGRTFDIDRIEDIRPAASLKAGGCGMRYICSVRGRRLALFLDNNRWFAEV